MYRPVGIVALLLLSAVYALSQTPPTTSQTVRISFTAINKNKQAVTTLDKEKIRLLEDDAPQTITSLERDTEQPLALVIMLDTSASQERALPNAKFASQRFVETVMRKGKDEAAVITFTGEATLETDFTSDVLRVNQALDRAQFVRPLGIMSEAADKAVASTAIWDALWLATNDVLEKSKSGARRGIVILTDGIDTASRIKMKEAINRAIEADVAIFVIGIGDEMYSGVDQDPLREAAEKTGGKFFLPQKLTDLPEVFAEIKQELVAPYVVTYTSTSKKKKDSLRRVRIEITDAELRKQNLKLLYRRGHFVQ